MERRAAVDQNVKRIFWVSSSEHAHSPHMEKGRFCSIRRRCHGFKHGNYICTARKCCWRCWFLVSYQCRRHNNSTLLARACILKTKQGRADCYTAFERKLSSVPKQRRDVLYVSRSGNSFVELESTVIREDIQFFLQVGYCTQGNHHLF